MHRATSLRVNGIELHSKAQQATILPNTFGYLSIDENEQALVCKVFVDAARPSGVAADTQCARVAHSPASSHPRSDCLIGQCLSCTHRSCTHRAHHKKIMRSLRRTHQLHVPAVYSPDLNDAKSCMCPAKTHKIQHDTRYAGKRVLQHSPAS
jgi:hypothetical protein